MTVLSRKTKTASLAMVAIAAFAIAAPQARAELPDGYEQLLYIETWEGGHQCIATDVYPDFTHKIEMRMRVLKMDARQFLWAASGSANGLVAHNVGFLTETNTLSFAYRLTYNGIGNEVELWHDYTIVEDGKNHTTSLTDETTDETWFGTLPNDEIISQSFPKIPFYGLLSDNAVGYNTICRLYSFTITDTNDTVVGNFVPARCTSNNVVGLYNTVTGGFLTPIAGGQPLKASPDVTIVPELDELKGEATLTFDAVPVRMDVVVAWGEEDYGTRLDGWPSNKHCKLGSVAETENEVSHTFTLPDEALVPGTRIRYFLGIDAARAATITIDGGAIPGLEYTEFDGSTDWPRIVPGSCTYTFVGGETPETAVEVPDGVRVSGTLKTTGYISLTDLQIKTGGKLVVESGDDGNITGSGTLTFASFPAEGTIEGLTNSTWHGTVNLPAANGNLSRLVELGNAGSDINFAGTTGSNNYIMNVGHKKFDIGAINLTGDMVLDNGSSYSTNNFARISGTGNLTLTGWAGLAEARYNLGEIKDYTGTLTVSNGITRAEGGTLTIGIGNIVSENTTPGTCVLPIVQKSIGNPTGTIAYDLADGKLNGVPANLEVREDGVYLKPVACIGETEYFFLADAFAAATDGQTIKVIANCGLAGGISVTKNLTLDLNGFTVTGANEAMFNINASGIGFTITDTSEDAAGKAVSPAAKIVLTGKECTFTLEAGTLESGDIPVYIWGGYNNPSARVVNINGGKIVCRHPGVTPQSYNNESCIMVSEGTVNMTAGEIESTVNGFLAKECNISGGTVKVSVKVFFILNGAHVSGGTFNMNISDRCVDGYEAFQETPGLWTVRWWVYTASETVYLDGDDSVELTENQATWLKACGKKTVVSNALESVTLKQFSDAYLLNLDVTKEFGYEFKVTGVEVGDSDVKVTVSLTRTGALGGSTGINGKVAINGAETLGGAFETISEAVVADDDFSDGSTTTITLDKGDAKFLMPVIK